MQEYVHEQDLELKIDLHAMIRNFFHILKKTWWWVLLLAALIGGLRYTQARRNFVPMYTATASFSVKSSYVGTTDLVDTTQYYDSQATEQVVSSFPYIIRSEAMQERIRLTLDTTWINGTVSASSIGETNIFTLTVTSNQPQDAYDILNAVIENYQPVASFVIGSTQLTMIQEPVVPSTPVNTFQGTRTGIKWGRRRLAVGFGADLPAVSRQEDRTDGRRSERRHQRALHRDHSSHLSKKRSKSTGNAVSILNPHVEIPCPFPSTPCRSDCFARSRPGKRAGSFWSPVPCRGGKDHGLFQPGSFSGAERQASDFGGCGPASSGDQSPLWDYHPSAGLLELSSCKAGCRQSSHLGAEHQPASPRRRYQNGLPMGILDSPKMRSLLEQIRALADYVIIDAPPAGILADAAVLCRSADQVLFVVRYDGAPRSQVMDAMYSVTGKGAELSGFVINGRPSKKHDGYGYHRYGYGKYGYGSKYGYGKSSGSKV